MTETLSVGPNLFSPIISNRLSFNETECLKFPKPPKPLSPLVIAMDILWHHLLWGKLNVAIFLRHRIHKSKCGNIVYGVPGGCPDIEM